MSQREFDLEQALAGHPVVTRDGRPVTQMVKFDCKYEYRVFGVVDGAPASWMESGQHTFYKDHPCDLFMAPVKKTGWVARWGAWLASGVYGSEEEAKKAYPHALSYHEIEWED
jgi:hypothetical protein